MSQVLSPPRRPLCVVGRLGREKKRAREPRLFPLPIVPRALSIFFDYCYFYRDTQREPLRRRESQDSFKGILIYPKTGHPTSIFGKYLIGRQFEIQNIRSICCMKNFLLAFLSYDSRTSKKWPIFNGFLP